MSKKMTFKNKLEDTICYACEPISSCSIKSVCSVKKLSSKEILKEIEKVIDDWNNEEIRDLKERFGIEVKK